MSGVAMSHVKPNQKHSTTPPEKPYRSYVKCRARTQSPGAERGQDDVRGHMGHVRGDCLTDGCSRLCPWVCPVSDPKAKKQRKIRFWGT